jgi:hypothetical protein
MVFENLNAALAAPGGETAAEPTAPARERGRNGRFVPSNGPGTEPVQDHKSAAREAFRAHFDDVAKNRIADLTGTVVKEPEQAPEAKAPEASPEEDAGNVDSEAVEAGLSALKRLKVPTKLIGTLSKAEIAEYGVEAKRQYDAQREQARELGELRKGATQQAAGRSAASEKSDQPAFDLDAALKRLEPSLDEEAVAVVGQISKAQKAENDQLRADLKSVLKRLEPFETDRAVAVLDKTKTGLLERFQQLSDEDVYSKKVLPRMAKLNQPDEEGNRPYSDMNELMLHACKIELTENVKSQPQSPKTPRAPSPISDTSRARPGPKSIRDFAKAAYANSHLPVNEIMKIAGGVRSA